MGPLDNDVASFQKRIAEINNTIANCYKQVDDNKSVIKYTTNVIDKKAYLPKEILIQAYLRRGNIHRMRVELTIKKIYSKSQHQKINLMCS